VVHQCKRERLIQGVTAQIATCDGLVSRDIVDFIGCVDVTALPRTRATSEIRKLATGEIGHHDLEVRGIRKLATEEIHKLATSEIPHLGDWTPSRRVHRMSVYFKKPWVLGLWAPSITGHASARRVCRTKFLCRFISTPGCKDISEPRFIVTVSREPATSTRCR
jgi:hypothetical protein